MAGGTAAIDGLGYGDAFAGATNPLVGRKDLRAHARGHLLAFGPEQLHPLLVFGGALAGGALLGFHLLLLLA